VHQKDVGFGIRAGVLNVKPNARPFFFQYQEAERLHQLHLVTTLRKIPYGKFNQK
jgi:hypothetical protein